MSTGERNMERSFWVWARDLALNVLVFAGAQILLALLFWLFLFRSHPQGFAMGLSLAGFGSWFLAFVTSFRARPRPPGAARFSPPPETPKRSADTPIKGILQAPLGNAGCGTILFLSGLVTLGLAFALRVRADMQAGKTWSDIFPIQP